MIEFLKIQEFKGSKIATFINIINIFMLIMFQILMNIFTKTKKL